MRVPTPIYTYTYTYTVLCLARVVFVCVCDVCVTCDYLCFSFSLNFELLEQRSQSPYYYN